MRLGLVSRVSLRATTPCSLMRIFRRVRLSSAFPFEFSTARGTVRTSLVWAGAGPAEMRNSAMATRQILTRFMWRGGLQDTTYRI